MITLLLLLLFLSSTIAIDDVNVPFSKETKLLVLNKLQWRLNHASIPHLPQRSRTVEGTTILEMKLTKPREEDLMKFLASDDARVSSLQFRIRNGSNDGRAQEGSSSMEVQIPLSSGAKLSTLNYVVTVELGGRKMTVIVDTGSDLTWVQCKPCTSCYNQQDPVFDPSASPSYRSIPCNSSSCDSLTLATGNSGICSIDQQSCSYSLSYGDGSYSHGVLSSESINLGSMLVNNFIFGCGESNRGLFGGTSGLMGLGRTQLSLVSQTAFQFGGVFSYCLPTSEFESSGSLVLGSNSSVYRNSTPITYTRLITDPLQAPFYYLNLTSISVGGMALQASGFSDGRILIDSGTVITRLVPSVYRALRNEFVKQFSDYPPAPGFSILDTCFNLTGYKEVNIPTLRLKFEGEVEVSADATGVLYFVQKDASQVCLAFASLWYEDEIAIFGNYQQKEFEGCI
ncbi:hypothetical protein J5N97_026917 [Dioscorea zingiberensis]|uniref:Peptidase A1 domain-containing protein n=1 Tax=Dioscorea zingiberensis TaxID=325984 RepID=A0A9D5H750_9LILI|nr:hypothetical protein J5N97_026917 [Dioscorea zingiberensis]